MSESRRLYEQEPKEAGTEVRCTHPGTGEPGDIVDSSVQYLSNWAGGGNQVGHSRNIIERLRTSRLLKKG